ncbi:MULTISPECIES: GDP-L-fucose synthase [unclassified Yoonia]|uniref:GDP-L-fucose synthase family protein n=1 Tax=unclassified Yoonia TaxID=2629118 RepID=UPI002AFEDFD7|nr:MULTISPECIES: GDP-L-fucose synthase [unclassified Yoonia]
MRIFIAGHGGMVGSAILRLLRAEGVHQVITADRCDLDLTDQAQVRAFMQAQRPDAVVLAAAKVGGIMANATQPADFITDNLLIATHVIHAAHDAGVRHLVQLGSSCIYPRDAAQPMAEEALLTGPLEPTNAPYAIAKIAAIKLCESYNLQHGHDYRSLMPTNLYGPGDNFHPAHAHVLPALLSRFHQAVQSGAKAVTIWGSGAPRREFLHVDDLAAALLFVMRLDPVAYRAETTPTRSHLNIGWGQDISIRDLAQMIAEMTGFRGQILYDTSKPGGTPRKLLDTARMQRLGWRPQIALPNGLRQTFDWYLSQHRAGLALRCA